ncbi:MAG: hypothetical protein ACRC7G_05225, partial [Beijerinckiaceae bacterium]
MARGVVSFSLGRRTSPLANNRTIPYRHPMLTGLLAGLLAGALWGLTFVAPRAVQPYGEVDLAILRYLAFGLTSLALMAASPRFRPGKLTRERVLLALVLGL